jgi:Cytochrome P460
MQWPTWIVLGALGLGCSAANDQSKIVEAAPGSLSDPAIEALSATYTQFAKLDQNAFPNQQHAGGAMVHVYANETAATRYRQIDTTKPAPSDFAFPPGSMLVKEMLDPAGGKPVLTVMYKKAPGYDSEHKDWWYGRLNPDGSPTNPAFAGKIDFCVGCHAGTAKWDYAWGLPAANLRPTSM